MMWGRLALGQTQAQIDMVNVYGAYLSLECGMEMVANAFPTLAERANTAQVGVQTAFSRTLAYIDKSMTSGTPNGATKWPELKRNTRRQMLQLLSVPSNAESATEVIMTVEEAARGNFPPTLRKNVELMPVLAHPLHCQCARCASSESAPSLRPPPLPPSQEAAWETVSIPGICTYQIPPTVELQKGIYKKFNDQFRKTILEVDTTPDRVVAQPKGINDFDSVSTKRYCRIIVQTDRGSIGDYSNLDEPLALSENELRETDRAFKSQIQQDASRFNAKGVGMTLISWEGTKITRVNGVDALVTTYARSMNDGPPALVRIYTIQNNDCVHKITISYRESESSLWAADLGKVIGTFKFKNR